MRAICWLHCTAAVLVCDCCWKSSLCLQVLLLVPAWHSECTPPRAAAWQEAAAVQLAASGCAHIAGSALQALTTLVVAAAADPTAAALGRSKHTVMLSVLAAVALMSWLLLLLLLNLLELLLIWPPLMLLALLLGLLLLLLQ
jgi:hypothetical protein